MAIADLWSHDSKVVIGELQTLPVEDLLVHLNVVILVVRNFHHLVTVTIWLYDRLFFILVSGTVHDLGASDLYLGEATASIIDSVGGPHVEVLRERVLSALLLDVDRVKLSLAVKLGDGLERLAIIRVVDAKVVGEGRAAMNFVQVAFRNVKMGRHRRCEHRVARVRIGQVVIVDHVFSFTDVGDGSIMGWRISCIRILNRAFKRLLIHGHVLAEVTLVFIERVKVEALVG